MELTAQEKEEAEQMQQDERLRRRNPKAYNDLMEKRREKARTQYTCPADYSASTTPSIQHVHWGNGPLIASRDMILPPSTDPNLGAMVGGIGQHYPYPIVATARASIPPLILPYEKTPLVDKSATSSLSTPEEHSRTESIPPSVLSRANPLPKSLPESTIPLLKGDDAKTREALGVAIDDLFELTETSRDDVSAGREHISKILVKAESKDIYNIMLKKEMENKYVIGSDTLRKTYSHELRRYIRERARNDADYERLAKGVKRLLEEDFTDPQTLVHVIADRLGIANAKSSSHQNGEHPNDPQAQPETCVSTNGGTEAVQGRSNGPKNQKEARKHSLPPEEQRSGKKLKRPSIITPDSSSAIAMDVQFENLMERESKRY